MNYLVYTSYLVNTSYHLVRTSILFTQINILLISCLHKLILCSYRQSCLYKLCGLHELIFCLYLVRTNYHAYRRYLKLVSCLHKLISCVHKLSSLHLMSAQFILFSQVHTFFLFVQVFVYISYLDHSCVKKNFSASRTSGAL